MRCGRFRGGLAATVILVLGCSKQGSVTFEIAAPDPASGQSPLADPRRDSIAIIDELTGMALGTSVTALGEGGQQGVGLIPVGSYDVRMSVTGGGQLLGLARARGVAITADSEQVVTLNLRKPIYYYGSLGSLFNPQTTTTDYPADPLMQIDTTLGALPPYKNVPQVSATASTHDGRFVLVASPGQVGVLDTLGLGIGGQTATVTNSDGTKARIAALAAAPDDSALAVITDDGLAVISDLPSLTAGASTTAQAVKLDHPPRRVAWSSDATTIGVLTSSAPWDTLDCAKTTSSLYQFAAAAPTTAPAPQPVTPVATDLAWTSDRIGGGVPANTWVFTSPCPGGGIFALGGSRVADGDFYSLAATDEQLIAVDRTLMPQTVDVDPEDPTQHNVTIPFGRIQLVPGGKSTLFKVPSDTLDLRTTGQSMIEVKLRPHDLVAYETSASRDGTHLVVLTQTRYQVSALRYVDLTDSCGDKIHCDATIVRDIIRVTEVDAATGAVGYERVAGVRDTTCTSQCFECIEAICGGLCTDLQPAPPSDCSTNFGFLAHGGSTLMGFR